ncbi:hypothetical protein DID88_008054 [Monilinia fructigena]|uniref:Copper-fist domain-containing protein n=1 Tax=Monilinia fructigena TaxID=38457 RepID=A0A395J475_9HELO|nr:hypothetical protein DID88_008054 [Monilinia fructigena]
MPIINEKKYSCEPCIRGHRATSCKHSERLMVLLPKLLNSNSPTRTDRISNFQSNEPKAILTKLLPRNLYTLFEAPIRTFQQYGIMADRLNDYSGETSTSSQVLTSGADKSLTHMGSVREGEDQKIARYTNRMHMRELLENQRKTAWDKERDTTDDAAWELLEHLNAEEEREEERTRKSNKWGSRMMKFKLHSKQKQNQIKEEARQKRAMLENKLESAREAEQDRWLLELGRYRNSETARVHYESCIPSKEHLIRGETFCEDCNYDYERANMALQQNWYYLWDNLTNS